MVEEKDGEEKIFSMKQRRNAGTMVALSEARLAAHVKMSEGVWRIWEERDSVARRWATSTEERGKDEGMEYKVVLI